ncbi:hypothetical protein BG011_000829 [Mortierella polycephala]|uniref:Uncharacterized protein n=1 Tax=Mortierella polycephala TaxID=41804 RepID=A0A9P6PL42_9FUNG|nr:hypothetical protein BG011_000829 [Mortierella polycephala]
MSKNDTVPVQRFRSPTNGEVIAIRTKRDKVTGSYFVLWQDIQNSFKTIRRVQAGAMHMKFMMDSNQDDIHPLRIEHRPDLTLDVVLEEPFKPSEDAFIGSSPQITLKTEADDCEESDSDTTTLALSIRNQHQCHLHLSSYMHEVDLDTALTLKPKTSFSQRRHSEPQSESDILGSYVQAIMSGQVEQAEGIKATIHGLFNALQRETAETIQLQSQVLKNQLETQAMQQKMHAMQETMLTMQQHTLDRLSVIQTRIQALITQTYELHEYPIPRLFIMLPKDRELWDRLNPFTHTFRLYFLCECGKHTKPSTTTSTTSATSATSTISHHVHIAKHEGYDLQRPTEFFEKYGPYVLTMMQMVKYGVVAAGVAVPAIGQLKLAEGIDSVKTGLDIKKHTLGSLMDETISYVQSQVKDGNNIDAPDSTDCEDVFAQEALEGSDLRQLESFLKTRDEGKVLGNLYRIVTTEGHVKWVCLDHYRENYKESATAQLRDLVAVNGGVFDEQQGSVDTELSSPSAANGFYETLVRARGVQSLSVKLAWDATKTDLQQFHNAIMRSNILALRVDGSSFDRPPRDFVNRGSRFDPLLRLVIGSKLKSFSLLKCDKFLERISSNLKGTTSTLRTLRLDHCMLTRRSILEQKIATRIYKRCPNLKELSIDCTDLDSAYLLMKDSMLALPSLSVVRIIKTQEADEATLHIKDGQVSSMDLILEEALGSAILFSGSVRTLTLSRYIFAEYDPKHFNSSNFVTANPGLEKLSLESSVYGLFATMHHIDKLAYGHSRSLAVTIYDGAPKEMMHPKSAKEVILGICELSEGGVDSASRLMNGLQVEVLQIFNYKEVDVSFRRQFVTGLDPLSWSKLAKLQLTHQELDEWIQDLSQVMARTSLPSLESLTIADKPGSAPLSAQSARWIGSLTCRQENQRSLIWLSLWGVSFSESDWDCVLSEMDLLSLEHLSFDDSNILKEQVDTLVGRIPEQAALRSLGLPGRWWNPDEISGMGQFFRLKTGHDVHIA